jgi:hypothetical protein
MSSSSKQVISPPKPNLQKVAGWTFIRVAKEGTNLQAAPNCSTSPDKQ